MRKTIAAKEIFLEYRRSTEREVATYNHLKSSFPLAPFPRLSGRIWRFGMLAEIWGTIATQQCGGAVDYLDQWRQGK